jgi:hypothetical protein
MLDSFPELWKEQFSTERSGQSTRTIKITAVVVLKGEHLSRPFEMHKLSAGSKCHHSLPDPLPGEEMYRVLQG